MANKWNAKKSAALRSAMLAAVSPRDIYDITKLQTFLALRGDTYAAHFVMDRVIGKAVPMNEMIEIENAAHIETDEAHEMVEVQLRAMWGSIPNEPRALESP